MGMSENMIVSGVMERVRQASRPLSAVHLGWLALGASGAFLAVLVVGFPLYFAPGWANGWPAGLTIHRVWSAWFSSYLFALMLSAGTAAGAMAILLLGLFPPVRRRSGVILLAWLALWIVLTTLPCARAYPAIHASALEMWPNGYPGADP